MFTFLYKIYVIHCYQPWYVNYVNIQHSFIIFHHKHIIKKKRKSTETKQLIKKIHKLFEKELDNSKYKKLTHL